MTYQILEYPKDTQLLRRVAERVSSEEFGTDALYDFGERLAETMSANRGLGLASTQVAWMPAGHCWRVFVLGVSVQGGPPQALICWNPVIVSSENFQSGTESCLSFAYVTATLAAPTTVQLIFQDGGGDTIRRRLDGILARAAWHEAHHLEGNLIVDRMGPLKRRVFLQEVTKRRARRG